MTATRQPYDGVALVAPVHLDYARRSEQGAAWFAGRVLKCMLQKAGLEKEAVDGIAIASFTLQPDTAVSLAEYFSMQVRWLEQLPMGGASGPVAIKRAARAIQAGDAEIIACAGVDTANRNSFRSLLENFSTFSSAAVYPYAAAGPNLVFSMITRHYMDTFGAQREDFARICLSQRRNALAAGTSLFAGELTLKDYLDARPIAEPLHLFDCVMPCAGADGFLLMSTERADSLGLPYAVILAAEEYHNAYPDDEIHFRAGWLEFRDSLYDMAGMGPADMDFLQTYDDYPVICLIQMEDLGFCEKGAAAGFVNNTDLDWDGGGLPHNTCGGQLSAGQAGAAGGFLGTVEAARQLLEEDLPNRVAGASKGLVSGYGMVNFDRCLCSSAVILARGDL